MLERDERGAVRLPFATRTSIVGVMTDRPSESRTFASMVYLPFGTLDVFQTAYQPRLDITPVATKVFGSPEPLRK